ncbi:MAG: flagellar basal body-associated FliL family protein [Armatimonadota bacterium]
MYEEVKDDAPKKKGGKLPIILALVVLVGGGGFFMMKKGKKPEKTEVKLAKEEILLPDEFIVNMLDGRTYVRAKIALKGGEKFKAEEVERHNAEVCDAINSILKNTKPEDVVTESQVKKLKIRVAAALNKIFKESEEHKKEEGKDGEKKKDEKSDSSEKSDHESSSDESEKDSEKGKSKKPEKIPNDWDSAEGPIYKVFFKALATQ